MIADFYVGWYSDSYGQEPPQPSPAGRQSARVARFGSGAGDFYVDTFSDMYAVPAPGAQPRLVVSRVGRSQHVGVASGEGWERVSSVFDVDDTAEGFAAVDAVVAAAVSGHLSDPADVLAARVDVALSDAGFRRLGGQPLRAGWGDG